MERYSPPNMDNCPSPDTARKLFEQDYFQNLLQTLPDRPELMTPSDVPDSSDHEAAASGEPPLVPTVQPSDNTGADNLDPSHVTTPPPAARLSPTTRHTAPPSPPSAIDQAPLSPVQSSSSSDSLPPPDQRVGDLAPKDAQFTPILALAKYPYKFVSKNYSQAIASAFFDGGKFWARDWDL